MNEHFINCNILVKNFKLDKNDTNFVVKLNEAL